VGVMATTARWRFVHNMNVSRDRIPEAVSRLTAAVTYAAVA